MKKKPIVLGLCLGCGIGVLMNVILYMTVQPNVMAVWNVIHVPVLIMANWWMSKPYLPPRGEVAWVVVPMVMVIVQWALVGLLFGFMWALLERKRNHERPGKGVMSGKGVRRRKGVRMN